MTSQRNNKGVVLIYALLVIGLFSAIALTVSLVIINELRLTSSSTDGVLAYYAAESGIEQGLYGVKAKRNEGVTSLSVTVALVSGYSSNFISNNASFNDDQTSYESSLIVDRSMAENEIVQADYYDVDSPLDPKITPLEDSRLVDHITVTNAGANPDSWAEVSWIGWDGNGLLITSSSAKKIIGPTDLTNGWTISLSSLYTSGPVPVGYRFRVRALFGPLASLTVQPFNTVKAITDFPSQVVIKSVGKRNSFKQALTAAVPWRLPLSGLYDYVLFSEGELTKNIILSKAVYSSGVIQVEPNLTSTCASCGACTTASPSWQAVASSCVTSQCTIGTTSYCTAGPSGTSTLPIPAAVSGGGELYVSMRVRGTAAGTGMVAIDDPTNGQVGFTFNTTDPSNWQTCTIPESFELGSVTAGRTITFSNVTSGVTLDVDWYQVSSYKVFPDCPTS
jgi:hypothetical protein